MEMHTIADMRAGIVAIGEALGLADEARARSRAIERAVDEARSRAAARTGDRPVVLAVVDRSPGALSDVVVAGPGSYIDELLAIVGAANAMAASGVRYSHIGAEQILRARPDIILDSVHGQGEEAARADWNGLADVPAVDHGRIHLLDHRMFISPSPRADQALRGLEERIYGIRRE
jgi:iron complex transport system substrate-binding protein